MKNEVVSTRSRPRIVTMKKDAFTDFGLGKGLAQVKH